MLRKRKENLQHLYKKMAGGIALSVLFSMSVLVSSPKKSLYEIITYQTMPMYDASDESQMFFKVYATNKRETDEPDNIFISAQKDNENIEIEEEKNQGLPIETMPTESAPTEAVPTEPKEAVIGINDIVYQDEEEFGPLPDSGFKENFTAKNLDRLSNRDYFISSFYNKDSGAGVIKGIFDPEKFLTTNLKIEKTIDRDPQVLIFHTHGGSEYFYDSKTGDLSEGIIGAGEQLKYVLENKYGISALHHKELFDMTDGKSNRNGSYERMEPTISQILQENPSIEIVIDLHRDGIEPNPNLVTIIDGKPYAKIMFVNGLSAIKDGDEIKELNYLKNPNLKDNLAYSFNMQIAANELYPNFTRKILLKPYRFSTHMKAKSLLVEVGSQYNTKEEAFNSMELLADLIQTVNFDKS